MPRQRKQTNETKQEADIRRNLEKIANTANRSDKVSWNRKMDNMVKLLSEIRPIEDKILELEISKQPILDAIAKLRLDMVNECIHPYDQLSPIEDGMMARCGFCNRRITARDDS